MTSHADEDIPTCRYCLDTGQPLLSPCRCIGTQAYIHRACQEQAYHANGAYTCPVCLQVFRNVELNAQEYIVDDETNPSVFTIFLGYFLPVINLFVPIAMYPPIMETVGLKTYHDRALLFALFELSWQCTLTCIILFANIGFRVKRRNLYLYYLATTPIHNYLAMHMVLVTYLTAFLWRADNPMYQTLLIASQCITHMYETQHIYILKKINEGIPRVQFTEYPVAEVQDRLHG
jgi:hypothetical protein